ncbi:predicted protein [Histoplasma mississippiense (nom. inval.)]|uniref:predicted protein n=1 Tax=Ajellomyces capsulatus (strain NAm1 / WU24) TaxID=2059318 RepID=UPI000157B699|nr:predicted protein [Histoplasma mississippiense (nom. inval.)]EDN02673.1 predicted protein [Histoplasma mississippiense (nom. inval.)]
MGDGGYCTRGSSRTGKEVKRAGKPRTSLPNILENLHILLRSPYFSEWPLEVRFFSADVWQVWSQSKDNLLDNSIKVTTAFSSKEAGDTDRREILGKRIETLDTGYDALIEYVEKSQFLLESEEVIDCVGMANPNEGNYIAVSWPRRGETVIGTETEDRTSGEKKNFESCFLGRRRK